MEKFEFDGISGRSWKLEEKKAIVIISHGMAEQCERYDWFAQNLNKEGIEVWAINQISHGDDTFEELHGHWPKDGFYRCVENLKKLLHTSKKDNIPVFLFGHSMGSFISQEFIKRYGNELDGVILSGSSKTGLLHKMGNVIANGLFACSKNSKQNKFLDKLSFGAYNNAFKPNRTAFDWLSRDNEQVDKYIADPLCGIVCTTGFFKGFMKGLAKLNKNVKNVPTSLPVLLVAGDKDPVGANGKGVIALKDMYIKNKIEDVTMKLYPEARHEILNEINKEEVCSDIINWLNSHIK